MSKIVTDSKNYSDIADAIRAKGISGTFKPNEMADAIESISGGTEITDGIVVKARDANGYATEVDLYGTDIPKYLCGMARTDNNSIGGFSYLDEINIKNNVISLGTGAFKGCGYFGNGIQRKEFSHLISLGGDAFAHSGFTALSFPALTRIEAVTNVFGGKITEIILPKCTVMLQNNSSYGYFRGATTLTNVEIGSVNYPVSSNIGYQFRDCTQSGLTITIFTTGALADTRLAAIRNFATNATIIIKASEDTTYNGETYSAGDTILTSEVA